MERRRRERTNNIIDELKALIPWLRDEARLQKLEVLEQCVCYIKELQVSGAAPSSPKRRRLVQTVHDEEDEEEHMSSDYKDNASRSISSVCADERPLAQYRSRSPVHVNHVPGSAKSATAFSDVNAECWNAVAAAGHSQMASSDLPDLVDDSGVSSKASSTVSTITPFRLYTNDDTIKGQMLEGNQPSSPQVKNSIDFLTS
ncbi:hypothetical protein LPJ53_003924 [Coemansia erecta]|uniref:BHLH domain-containing protein n=1 Tax=Coemansia erecta TaxID=147472 RepID=A0A9W7XYX9_9FUNG|nr:hypothetical protein LPJ53_003924 [Coemansia erecta]